MVVFELLLKSYGHYLLFKSLTEFNGGNVTFRDNENDKICGTGII